MDRSICPQCGGERQQKIDRKGRGRGWRCRSCENKRQIEIRHEDSQRLKLGLTKTSRRKPSSIVCPKCGRNRRPRFESGRRHGWRCHFCYRQKHKQQLTAHDKVEWAIKTGILVRQTCEVCSRPDADAHHDDYSKPLEVRWLCSKHHAVMHARIKE